MSNDVVLITVDCWRHDTVDRMPKLRSLTTGFDRTDVICAGAATNGVFPAILNGSYYPTVYDNDGQLGSDTISLPQLLSNAGYATGAFVASNPFLNKWADHFDEYWNPSRQSKSDARRAVDRAKKLLFLTKEVTATEVATRAQEWYEQAEGPRFLLMHLMEPHSPFNPGLREGLRQGLLSSYRAIVEYELDELNSKESLSRTTQETIEDLYWRCVDQLDKQFGQLISFLDDDATVLITADHGEELHHGYYAHARLYDECTRVPLLTRWTLGRDPALSTPLRQIDLAPTILSGLGIETPDSWNGRPITKTTEQRDVFMLNHSPGHDEFYVGVRTGTHKYIRTYDSISGNVVANELYDLEVDPSESENYWENDSFGEELSTEVDRFIDTEGVLDGIVQTRTNVSKSVENRLEELGYK